MLTNSDKKSNHALSARIDSDLIGMCYKKLKWIRQCQSRDSQVLNTWPGKPKPQPKKNTFRKYLHSSPSTNYLIVPKQLVFIKYLGWEHLGYCYSFITHRYWLKAFTSDGTITCNDQNQNCLIRPTKGTFPVLQQSINRDEKACT